MRSHSVTIRCTDCEYLFCVTSGPRPLMLGVYLPPLITVNVYENYCNGPSDVLSIYPGCQFYNCGDFNLPYIDWIDDNKLVSFSIHLKASFNEIASADFLFKTFNFHDGL